MHRFPPRVDYELTAFGSSLEPVLHGLRDWGDKYERRLAAADRTPRLDSTTPRGWSELRRFVDLGPRHVRLRSV